MRHDPVLIEEVVKYLDIQKGDHVVDGTLGLGGHTKKFAELVGHEGRVIGFDLDNLNLQQARKNLNKFEGRIIFVNDSFSRIDHYNNALKLDPYNKVLLDLGVSSPHFDDPQRGFTFRSAGPLDMRFDKNRSLSADKIVHNATQAQLEDILRNFGEVTNYRKIARKIVDEREIKRFMSTVDFAERLSPVLPKANQQKVLAQIFQALRIAVNDELNTLQEGLNKLWYNMAVGGRFAVISYHSLEDRIVKQFFALKLRPKRKVINAETKSLHDDPQAAVVNKKVVVPAAAELEHNPRARSAKLRVYEKISN